MIPYTHQSRYNSITRTVTAFALGMMLLASCSSTKTEDSTGGPSSTAPAESKIGAVRSGPPDTPAKNGGKISYGILAEPEGLDPTRYAFSQDGHAVASAVFDSLATLDLEGNAVPYLATSFEPNAEFTSWTIAIPAGVTFHDDSPLNADALLKSFDAYKKSVITGTVLSSLVQDVTKSDDTHVTVLLKRPMRSFPVVLATQVGYVPAPAMIDSTEYVKKPIGSGPFVFDSHQDGQVWSFKKFTKFRQKDLPHLEAIEFKPIPDDAKRNQMLFDGDLDIIHTYTGTQVLELRARPDLKLVENRHGDKAFFMVNTQAPPFDNMNARKAIAFATDPARYIEGLHKGVSLPANSPFGPGQPGYLQDNGYPKFNPEEAKKALAAYKADTGKDLEFTFLAVSDQQNASIAQGYASDYEKAGMKVTVKQLPQINLIASVASGSYEMSQFRLWGAPNPDGDTHFYSSTGIVQGGVSLNFPRYSSKVIDDAVNEAAATGDPAKRTAAYERISRDLGQNVPFFWLGQSNWVVAASPRVNGIDGAMNGSLPTIGIKSWIHNLSIT